MGWTGVMLRAHPLLVLGSLCSVSCLVIDRPCCSNMLHVPAAFGPDLLTLDSPIRSQKLVVVDPEDACEELRNVDLRGKVALIRRGNCNFTEKIFRVQQHHALAAVVYDSMDRERWGTIMSGMEDEVWKVSIPSVFVSHSTGMVLRNASLGLLSSESEGEGEGVDLEEVLVTLNDTGHVRPKAKRIGPIETLATYVVVSLVLLSFSGCCGLLLALCITCYQRAFRVRALRHLKLHTFRRPQPSGKSRLLSESSCSNESLASSNTSTCSTCTCTSSSTSDSTATSTSTSAPAVSSGSTASSETPTPPPAREGATVMSATTTSSRGGSMHAFRASMQRFARLLSPSSPSSPSPASPPQLHPQSPKPPVSPLPSNTVVKKGLEVDVAWEEDDEDRSCCAICLDDYEDGDTLRLLPCGHSFHDVCIKPWLMEKSEACPMCKRPAFRRDRSLSLSDAPLPPPPTSLRELAVFLGLDPAALEAHGRSAGVVLMAVVTLATVLGGVTILWPQALSQVSGSGGDT